MMLSTSFNSTGRNLIGLSQQTERAKPPVHLFPSVFFHNLDSKIPLLLCQNAKVFHHAVAAFIFTLQEAHPLNAAVIHF
jgi:hypothetical protein